MINTYKIAFWNTFCFIALGSCFILIFPYIFLPPTPKAEEIQDPPPIIEINSNRKIWKRGKNNFSTIIKESSSSSNISGTNTHFSDGWTYIRWRKENDS